MLSHRNNQFSKPDKATARKKKQTAGGGEKVVINSGHVVHDHTVQGPRRSTRERAMNRWREDFVWQ